MIEELSFAKEVHYEEIRYRVCAGKLESTDVSGHLMLIIWFDRSRNQQMITFGNKIWSYYLSETFIKDTAEKGICVQTGTMPVEINGVWGGRNYPQVFISSDQMQKFWKEAGLYDLDNI